LKWVIHVFFSGCKKKEEAAELHAFPESHSNIAQYFHQFCLAYSGRAVPCLLLGDINWSRPSCLYNCQSTFLCSDIILSVLLLLVHSLCPNSRITLLFSEPQAGIALSDLRSLNDLYDPQSIALLFFIGIVSVMPTLLSKNETQANGRDMAASTN
jgi:hypothetical protein